MHRNRKFTPIFSGVNGFTPKQSPVGDDHHAINGKTHDFDWAMASSSETVKVYQRVTVTMGYDHLPKVVNRSFVPVVDKSPI